MSTKQELKVIAIANALLAGMNICFDYYWAAALHILIYILVMHLYNSIKGQ